MEKKLTSGYVIRSLEKERFFELFKPLNKMVFKEDHSLFAHEYLSAEENDLVKELDKGLFDNHYHLHLGIFDPHNNFIGWHFGFQESRGRFYMCNSGLLEEHRRKGLYTELLDFIMDHLKQKGFQEIYSRHNATNNAVLIPKLKKGFVISNMELSDSFGVLIHLTYFTNATRRKVMDYRSGQQKPDDELKKIFKI